MATTIYFDEKFVLVDTGRDDLEPAEFPQACYDPYSTPDVDPSQTVLIGKDRTGGRGHHYWLYVRKGAFNSLDAFLCEWKNLPFRACKQIFSIPFRTFSNTIQVYEDRHKGIIIGKKGWQIKAISAAVGNRINVGRTVCLIIDVYQNSNWAVVHNAEDFPQFKKFIWYWPELGIKTDSDPFFVIYYNGGASSDRFLYLDAKYVDVLEKVKPYRIME